MSNSKNLCSALYEQHPIQANAKIVIRLEIEAHSPSIVSLSVENTERIDTLENAMENLERMVRSNSGKLRELETEFSEEFTTVKREKDDLRNENGHLKDENLALRSSYRDSDRGSSVEDFLGSSDEEE